MIRKLLYTLSAAGLLAGSFFIHSLQPFRAVQAQTQKVATVTIQADKPRAATNPKQFGIFFEDINFGADGGIYAELIKNRSFEFPINLMGWSKTSTANGNWRVVKREDKTTNNHHYLLLSGISNGFAFVNEGFRGIGVKKGADYNLTLQAQRTNGAPLSLKIELVNPQNQTIASATMRNIKGEWKGYTARLHAQATEAKANLRITVEGDGDIAFDSISLFPKDTWKGRPNGLRADLIQLLADLKPGFLRFPGGCIVEGRELETRYQWKKTIGEPSERELIVNRWNTEFKHRPTPDYYQSFGLGFYEYFQLAEDIGAEPLPILNCGMACQFNSKELAPLNGLDEYIQDALDLIEFANGSVASKWGGKRAALGHPAPFNLKMIGIGNEQWGPDYVPRYEAFHRALKAKYPEIKLVSSAGPSASGEVFDFLWGKLRGLNADLIDEHYYMRPDWFLKNAGRYDNYDRKGPHVFAGEYAAQSSGTARPDNRNNWETALAEAAFMTGLERNGDVVEISSYAPLFAHLDAWQWTPNLIWFDNLRSFGTPNYYVQKLFGNHTGTKILPIQINGQAPYAQNGLYGSAVLDDRSNELIVKLVNTANNAQKVAMNINGITQTKKPVQMFTLSATDLKAENSLDKPAKVAPQKTGGGNFIPNAEQTVPAQSMVVLRIGLQR